MYTQAKHEPYGNVHLLPSSGSAPSVRRRGVSEESYQSHGGAGAQMTDAPSGGNTEMKGASPTTTNIVASELAFRHNSAVAILLLPPIAIVLLVSSTSRVAPFLLALGSLVVYAFDLANSRDLVLICIWITFAVTACGSAAGIWGLDNWGSHSHGNWFHFVVASLARVCANVILLFCLACWSTLQLPYLCEELGANTARRLERLLVRLLPLTSSALMSYHGAAFFTWRFGIDAAATAMPYLVAMILAVSIFVISSVYASLPIGLVQGTLPGGSYGNDSISGKTRDGAVSDKVLTTGDGLVMSYLLVLLPPVVHFVTMRQRLLWIPTSLDSIYDAILAVTVPLLIQDGLKRMGVAWWFNGRQTHSRATKFSYVLALLAFQERYLVRMCATISLALRGYSAHSHFVTSTLLTCTILSIVGCLLLQYDAGGIRVGERLFGEYREDFVQLLLAVASIVAAGAVGIPWRDGPVVSVLVLSIWMFAHSRMLRFMSLFVIASSAVLVVFVLYRVGFIHLQLASGYNLLSVCLWSVLAPSLIFSATGFVYRAPGGIGASIKIDGVGIMIVGYAFVLAIVEKSLLLDVPANIFSFDPLYSPVLTVFTSALLVVNAVRLLRTKSISSGSAVATVAFSIGKLTILAGNRENGLSRIVFTTLLVLSFLAPYVFIEPVLTGPSKKRSRGIQNLPRAPRRFIAVFSFIWLPFLILLSSTIAIRPIIALLSNTRVFASQLVGWSLSLWGFLVTSTMRHVLPSGGGETLKKSALVATFLGATVAIFGPTLSTASAGCRAPLANYGSGVGIVVSIFSCLLALVGPLQMGRKWKSSISIHDSFLKRIMLLSILFGSGLSCSFTMQNMRGEATVAVISTTIACLGVSICGSVAITLGHFLNIVYFEEAMNVMKICTYLLPVFLLLSCFASTGEDSHPFGTGGWLSTFMIVCSGIFLMFSLGLKCRSEKSVFTRWLGNLTCIVSWLLTVVVLHLQHGLAFGSFNAASVLGTFLVSPFLLILDKGTVGDYSLSPLHRSSNKSSSSLRARLPELTKQSRLAPLFAGTAFVFTIVSLYVILLRGCADVLLGGVRSSFHNDPKDLFVRWYEHNAGIFPLEESRDITELARKNLIENDALRASAMLAGSSFCTSESWIGPLLHLTGVVASFPSLYMFSSYMWNGTKQSPASVHVAVPLNLFTIFLCRGIPSLQAVAVMGFVGGLYHSVVIRQTRWRRLMAI